MRFLRIKAIKKRNTNANESNGRHNKFNRNNSRKVRNIKMKIIERKAASNQKEGELYICLELGVFKEAISKILLGDQFRKTMELLYLKEEKSSHL